MPLRSRTLRTVVREAAQLLQLSFDMVVAPAQVLLGQAHNQVFRFLFNLGTTCFGFLCRLSPFAPHQLSMPADDYFWSDDANEIAKLANGAIRVLLELS